MNLATQYDNFAEDFSQNQSIGENSNDLNRADFYMYIDFLKPGMRVLDAACGDGTDLLHYVSLGVGAYGIDASAEMIKIAQAKVANVPLIVGTFENMPYEDNYFDAVLSKYALMTSGDMEPAFKEIHRVLKPGGTMLYLVTHPFRHYFEKKNPQADYFKQEIVDSHILSGSVTVQEPSHTMNDFLSNFLFQNFDVQTYRERWDPAAEQIDGRKYPGYFILKAVKR